MCCTVLGNVPKDKEGKGTEFSCDLQGVHKGEKQEFVLFVLPYLVQGTGEALHRGTGLLQEESITLWVVHQMKMEETC